MKRLVSCVWFLAIVACGGGGGTGSSTPAAPTNAAPVAMAGDDVSQSLVPTDLVLDGSASSDPDGDTLRFSWAVTTEPVGSSVSMSDADKAKASFATSVPGQYEFTLTVTDPAGASTSDSVAFDLSNDAPTLQIASFIEQPMSGEDVQFSAIDSDDVNGQLLDFTWEITSAPSASVIAKSYSGAAPIIRFDADGSYILRVEASDGFATVSLTLDPIDVTEFSKVALPDGFEDAEFDKVHERIVTVSGQTLSVVDKGEAGVMYSLPLAATAVSIDPAGNRAAIAHDGWVSDFSLTDKSLEATHSVPANIGDIIADSDGYAYAFPSDGQWTQLQTVNLDTGENKTVSLYPLRQGMIVRLHPDGKKIYGADNGLSPSDLERYNIAAGNATRAYDSPYHGDFPFCGDLWIGSEGNSILSRCGVIVRATDDQATDLTFMMQLGDFSGGIQHADSSTFNNAWYVVDGTGEGVKVYDADSGLLTDTVELPYVDGSVTDRWMAKYVFATDTSNLIYILAQDDLVTPQKFVLLKHHASGPVVPSVPVAVVPRYTTVRQNSPVILDASQSSDPESAPLEFAWTLISEPAGSAISPSGTDSTNLQFTPNVAGTYEFNLQVTAGSRSGALVQATVNVFETTDSLVHRLAGDIADIEYSKSMNAAVFVSDSDLKLHIVALDDFSETVVQLPRRGYRIGISPDGHFAAVSHSGLASLIDLDAGEVIDSQPYGEDWGDIVLDINRRAHIVPYRDQWSNLVSIDFAADQASGASGARANTQLRLHPNGLWIYGADVGLSPSDFQKWDATTFPAVGLGDSPYHGDYAINGNIWISETGNKLLVSGANAFHSSSNPALDMTYAGRLSDTIGVVWADHSEETGEWALTTSPSSDPLDGKIIFYEGQFLNRSYTLPVETIPSTVGGIPASATKVFQSDDGSEVIVLLEGATGTDRFAIQITDTVP